MFPCSHDNAFTLVELLVVIAITAIIAGLILANMTGGGEVTNLNSDAEKLAGIIKQAQMMALTGKQVSGSRPLYGYGVYLDTSTTPDSYKLFINDTDGANHAYDGGDTVIQTFNFNELVNFETFDHYFVIFVPPKGKIYVGTTSPGAELESGTSLMTLRHANNRYAWVEVNPQGQVDIRKTEAP